jgi:hypothetical protein
MGAFAQAGGNAGAQNFLAWVVNVGGVPLLIALVASIGCLHWFLSWFVRWHQRLSAAAFPAARSDLVHGVAVGLGCAAVWLLADFVVLWQRQAPFWNRQAWETRFVMVGMALLVGATVGTTVFQIRRFKKTFTMHGE